MLNKKQERELAYVTTIEEICPIANYDRVEYARVGAGWWVVVRKGQFKVGDPAIYFEIDSKVPDTEAFKFLESKHFKIKTQKMCKVVSQGLLMHAEDFGWTIQGSKIIDDRGKSHSASDETKFLTEKLGVTYITAEDNYRKDTFANKYSLMVRRHKKLFSYWPLTWLQRYNWGRVLLLNIFGKKRKKKKDWPEWVKKTDEERCQNMPWLFPDNNDAWIVTEKIDGTSTTFTLRGKGPRAKFYVCSRNVVFKEADSRCFYSKNYYLEMKDKYEMETTMHQMIEDLRAEDKSVDYLTIQAETYGEGVQKRTYGLTERQMAIFNIIIGYKNGTSRRLNPIDGQSFATKYKLPYVPIIYTNYKLPKTCDELIKFAEGESIIDGYPREGFVFRSYDGAQSFKAVSPSFLLKYHQ